MDEPVTLTLYTEEKVDFAGPSWAWERKYALDCPACKRRSVVTYPGVALREVIPVYAPCCGRPVDVEGEFERLKAKRAEFRKWKGMNDNDEHA